MREAEREGGGGGSTVGMSCAFRFWRPTHHMVMFTMWITNTWHTCEPQTNREKVCHFYTPPNQQVAWNPFWMPFRNLHLHNIFVSSTVLIKQHIFAVSYLEPTCCEVAVRVSTPPPLWVFSQGKQGKPCFGKICTFKRTLVADMAAEDRTWIARHWLAFCGLEERRQRAFTHYIYITF